MGIPTTPNALTAACVLACGVLKADMPEPLSARVFVTTSPSNVCYAVQTIVPSSSVAHDAVSRTRFQVFDARTGKCWWETNTIYGNCGEVGICDDGTHIVVLPTRIGVGGGEGYTLSTRSDLSEEERRRLTAKVDADLKAAVAISFYNRAKLVKSLSVADLDVSTSDLLFTASHVYVHASFFPAYPCLADSALLTEITPPRLWMAGHLLGVTFLDGRERIYDVASGALIRAHTVVFDRRAALQDIP